jgi:hydroxymethylpyrimidine pyrophosphatase-like HAD family hydrolase
VVRLMQSEGMSATVSSIHINGWYGAHNKLDGARWIVRELFGRALDAEIESWAYVGDSTNDQLMFERFPHSIGVANIRRFEAQLAHKPRYITRGERGAGFAEVAQALLAARA